MPKKSEKKNKEKTNEKIEKKVSQKLSQEEFEKKVIELADKGLTSEKIGENLRQEGIHPQEYDKKISKILKEKKKHINPDIKDLEDNLKRLREHYEKNKQDKKSMRDRDKIFSRIRKLKKYHRLPLK